MICLFFNCDHNHKRTLNDDDRLAWEVHITEEECLKALKEFKTRTTSDTDGFPAEFFRFFLPEIRKEMTESLKLENCPLVKDVE